MLKEIHEQPKVIRDTINSIMKDGIAYLDAVNLTDEKIKMPDQVYIIVCDSVVHNIFRTKFDDLKIA